MKQSDKFKTILVNLNRIKINSYENIQAMYEIMRYLEQEIKTSEAEEKEAQNANKL